MRTAISILTLLCASAAAGTGEAGFTAGGSLNAAQVRFDLPGVLAIDGGDVLYVADTNNHRVQIPDTVNGVRLRVWGVGMPGFSGNGGNAGVAELNFPVGMRWMARAMWLPRN